MGVRHSQQERELITACVARRCEMESSNMDTYDAKEQSEYEVRQVTYTEGAKKLKVSLLYQYIGAPPYRIIPPEVENFDAQFASEYSSMPVGCGLINSSLSMVPSCIRSMSR